MYEAPSPFVPPRSPNHLLRLTATFGIVFGAIDVYAAVRLRLLASGDSSFDANALMSGHAWWGVVAVICWLALAEIVSVAILPLVFPVMCIPALVRLEWKSLLGLAGVAFALALGLGFASPPITSW